MGRFRSREPSDSDGLKLGKLFEIFISNSVHTYSTMLNQIAFIKISESLFIHFNRNNMEILRKLIFFRTIIGISTFLLKPFESWSIQ